MSKKQICSLIMVVVMMAAMLSACGEKNDGYYREIWDNPLAKNDVGGSDSLFVIDGPEEITLENAHIRAIFSKKNGAIRELVNKDAKVYLTKDGSAAPLRINLIQDGTELTVYKYSAFRCSVVDGDVKSVVFTWTLAGMDITATASLSEDATELIFRLSYEGNHLELREDGTPLRSLYNVEYPIINNIDRLYSAERDHLLTPFITGYIIDDPVSNFNDVFPGIGKSMGLYPSGWEYPMQFQSYYSDGIGGFMFSTRDGGDGIKSFTFGGSDGKLRTSIYHYVRDLAVENGSFDYDIAISNLTQGSWYESADLYRNWASQQSWATEKGQLKDREDLNLAFYEDTVLCNFNFPSISGYGKEKQETLYGMVKESLQGGSILNIGFGRLGDGLAERAWEYGDLFMFFEFPSFQRTTLANDNPEMLETMIRPFKFGDQSSYYNVGTTSYFYACASCEEYLSSFMSKQENNIYRDGVDGLYHDVGISAVHPRQCFDTTHPHGTRVNLIPDYMAQMETLSDLARSSGGIYGQELVFEQMLPYLDFYQARANGGLLGWMEHDRVRGLIEAGVCHKVSLFDYVYGAYGAKRLDGFLTADAELGDGYYYVAAYTFVNGGIPEHNYETIDFSGYTAPEALDRARMEYLGKLYQAKHSFAGDYLVYGQMVKTPSIGTSQSTYFYHQDRFEWNTVKEGNVTLDDVVSCAYRLNETIGMVMANTSNKSVTLKFAVDTAADWGISQGSVYLVTMDGETQIGSIENGEAKIDVTLEPYEVAMIRIA